MLKLWLGCVCAVVLLVTSGLVVTRAGAQANDAAAVVTAFELARNRHDVDAALGYFADDAQITFRGTVYSGKADIRRFLETSARRTAEVSDRLSVGQQVSWTERTTPPNPGQTGGQGRPTGATTGGFVVNAEAIVQDGKIRMLSYALGSVAVRPDPTVEGRALLPAVAGLGAVVAIVLVVIVAASLGVRSAASSSSTLRGRLMTDLRGWTAARQSS